MNEWMKSDLSQVIQLKSPIFSLCHAIVSFLHDDIVLWSQYRHGHWQHRKDREVQTVHTAGATIDWNKSRSSKFNTATWCHRREKTRGRDCYKSVRHGLAASRDSPPRRHHESVKWEPTSIIDGPMHTLMRTGDKHTRSPQLRLDGDGLNARAEKFTSHENFIGRGGKAAVEHIITEWESEREIKARGVATENWCDFNQVHYFSKEFEWCSVTWEYILVKL